MLQHVVEITFWKPYGRTTSDLRGLLTFHAEDPFVVRISPFEGHPGWEVAIEILQEGLKRYYGPGRVRAWPAKPRRRQEIVVRIGNDASITLKKKALTLFLDQVTLFDRDRERLVATALERELLGS